MEDNEVLDSNILDQRNPMFDYEEASSGKRLANYIIDRVIIYILCFLAGILYVLVISSDEMATLTSFIIAIIISVSYYSITEATTGKSIGKLITRTKVLNDDYTEPTLGTIFKRSLCRLIPFEPFSFLGNNGWHDSITGTVVVND